MVLTTISRYDERRGSEVKNRVSLGLVQEVLGIGRLRRIILR